MKLIAAQNVIHAGRVLERLTPFEGPPELVDRGLAWKANSAPHKAALRAARRLQAEKAAEGEDAPSGDLLEA